MFHVLGKVVVRFWPALLVAWTVLLGVTWWLAPHWQDVVETREIASLPADAPSRRSGHLLEEAFPREAAGSAIVVVVTREDGELQGDDRDFIELTLTDRVKEAVEGDEEEETPLVLLRSPGDPGAGALLVSQDRQAALVVAELRGPVLDRQNAPIVRRVERMLDDLRAEQAVPEGLTIAITGSATAGRDLDEAEAAGARAVDRWTIVIVLALVLVMYRAPLVALIPLVTVFVAVRIAMSVLALLAQARVLTVYPDIQIIITVLAYGAGVDYCLFLIARCREEEAGGAAGRQAVATAIGQVGAAITASAATVIAGIGMLAFARFAKIHAAGLAIPIALVITLAAALTFSPALLRLAGRWAFWPNPDANPRRAGDAGRLRRWIGTRWLPNVWEAMGPVLLRWPGAIQLSNLAVLTVFAIVALLRYDEQNFNPISDLPASAPSVVGNHMVAQHFPPGMLGPATILIEDDTIDFASESGIHWVAEITELLRQAKDDLDIVDIRSVATPLGITAAAAEGLKDLTSAVDDPTSVIKRRAVRHYVSRDGPNAGHVTRLDLTLGTNPLSRDAIPDLDRIEAFLSRHMPAAFGHVSVLFSGTTATLRDFAYVKQGDEQRIQLLVPAVVFALLVFLLRRLVVSAYLIVTVLLSYLATLGITFLVFGYLQGQGFMGIDWKVPIFLFTILVAVGEDYNIFLLTRIREEQHRHGPLHGITVALARTGSVISNCGWLMAGTFATLLLGELFAMRQLGFALAFGILLDTLVVRPILVPSFLISLQSERLGRLGQWVALARAPAEAETEAHAGALR
jgi:RND superfamily putative drug exporter